MKLDSLFFFHLPVNLSQLACPGLPFHTSQISVMCKFDYNGVNNFLITFVFFLFFCLLFFFVLLLNSYLILYLMVLFFILLLDVSSVLLLLLFVFPV